MLRAYSLSKDVLGAFPVSRDEESALVSLIDAASTRVTLVIARSDLPTLASAVRRLSSGIELERTLERMTMELTNGGPGIRVIEAPLGKAVPAKYWKELLKSERIDAVVVSASGGSFGGPASSKGREISMVDADREVRSIEIDMSLHVFRSEDELSGAFRPLFRFGSNLVVIDPYFGAEALRAQAGQGYSQEGLAFVVRTAVKALHDRSERISIRVIGCQSHLKIACKKLLADAAKFNKPLPFDLESGPKAAEDFIKAKVVEYAKAAGVRGDRVDVMVHWHSADFKDRGCISAGRAWVVDHSLAALSEFLGFIGSSKPKPADPPRLRILQDAGAAQIRRLAESACAG
jgi:hypothetical protein